MNAISSIRLRAAGLIAACSLLLSGCFMAPGKFNAELALVGADEFTFVYDGEIFFLGLSGLAQMGSAADVKFTPSDCYDDQTFDQRECTADELREQRDEWDQGAARRAAENKQKAEQMAALMGGINPSDPAAADEVVKLLVRQKGWERVENLGDGLFKVRYSIRGTLGHDFMFPVIEGFPPTNPFIQTFARKNGQLRINAPGFAAQSSDGGMGAMIGGLGPLAALGGIGAMGSEDGDDSELANLPTPDGTFIIRTAGGMSIRANNTDEGPERTAAGEVLTWKITQRTSQMPTALIDLGR